MLKLPKFNDCASSCPQFDEGECLLALLPYSKNSHGSKYGLCKESRCAVFFWLVELVEENKDA